MKEKKTEHNLFQLYTGAVNGSFSLNSKMNCHQIVTFNFRYYEEFYACCFRSDKGPIKKYAKKGTQTEALKLTFSNLYSSKLLDTTINQISTNIVADNVLSDARVEQRHRHVFVSIH